MTTKKTLKIELWQFARDAGDGSCSVSFFNNEAAAFRAADIHLYSGGSLSEDDVSHVVLEFDENLKLLKQKYDDFDPNTGEKE